MGTIEFIFETFETAMKFHTNMFEMLRERKVVYYKDLIEMIYPGDKYLYEGLETHGWTYLCETEIKPCPNGKWVIKMPQIVDLSVDITIMVKD